MPNNRGFLFGLYIAFKDIRGFVVTFVSILLTFIVFYFLPTDVLSIKVLLPIGLFSLILIIVLFNYSISLYQQTSNVLPKVTRGSKPPAIVNNALALLLVEDSPWFSHEVMVSVYQEQSDYEQLIGYGYVLNIQENKMIQVVVTADIAQEPELWSSIASNNSDIVERLLVKPGSRLNFMKAGI